MAKATANSKASKSAAKPAAKHAAKKAARTVVRSASAVQAQIQSAPETSLYQVLQPFWLNGATVKPTGPDGAPVWIEMSAAEAREYQEAGVLGDEPAEVPDTHADDDEVADQTGGGNGAAAGSNPSIAQ
ncbi:hypothetical protein [Thermomonas sp.]|uniref:hypothetical protein n=1 Tax=Thermomonas sp. TaxID=1971895 RepID=UPI0035B0403D